jgi:nucleoside 2-deoxyribosyltransferase
VNRKPIVFLGGPFQFALKENGFDPILKRLIADVLEDLEHAGFRTLSAHRHESFGLLDVNGQSAEVAKRDFKWMTEADVFIAILPLNEEFESIRSDGTCVELGWASALLKPLVVVRSSRHVYSHLIEGMVGLTSAVLLDYEDVVQDIHLVSTVVSRLLTISDQTKITNEQIS